jgi:hypothetical protein
MMAAYRVWAERTSLMWAVSPGAPPTLLEGLIAPLREAQPTDKMKVETF